jgi:hypothetical protein
MLYVDQPIGTGFSYGTDPVTSTVTAAPYVWTLIQAFYAQCQCYPIYLPFQLHGDLRRVPRQPLRFQMKVITLIFHCIQFHNMKIEILASSPNHMEDITGLASSPGRLKALKLTNFRICIVHRVPECKNCFRFSSWSKYLASRPWHQQRLV